MDKFKAGQTVTVDGFVMISEYGYLTWHTSEMDDYTTITPHTITFTVPAGYNAVASEIAAIDKKLDTMADEYHGKVTQLNQRKNDLLCIENSPAEEFVHQTVTAPDFSDIDDTPF